MPDKLMRHVRRPPTMASETGNANSDPISNTKGREPLINIPPMMVDI